MNYGKQRIQTASQFLKENYINKREVFKDKNLAMFNMNIVIVLTYLSKFLILTSKKNSQLQVFENKCLSKIKPEVSLTD